MNICKQLLHFNFFDQTLFLRREQNKNYFLEMKNIKLISIFPITNVYSI